MKLYAILAVIILTLSLNAQTEEPQLPLLSYHDGKVFQGEKPIMLDELKTLLNVSGISPHRLKRAIRQLHRSRHPKPTNLRKLIEIPVGSYFLWGGFWWMIFEDNLGIVLLGSGSLMTLDGLTLATSKGYKNRAERNITKTVELYNYKIPMNDTLQTGGETDLPKLNEAAKSKLTSVKLQPSIVQYINGQLLYREQPISLDDFKTLLEAKKKSTSVINKAKRQLNRSIYPIPVNIRKGIELLVGITVSRLGVGSPGPASGLPLLALGILVTYDGATITTYEGYKKRSELNISRAVELYNKTPLLD